MKAEICRNRVTHTPLCCSISDLRVLGLGSVLEHQVDDDEEVFVRCAVRLQAPCGSRGPVEAYKVAKVSMKKSPLKWWLIILLAMLLSVFIVVFLLLLFLMVKKRKRNIESGGVHTNSKRKIPPSTNNSHARARKNREHVGTERVEKRERGATARESVKSKEPRSGGSEESETELQKLKSDSTA